SATRASASSWSSRTSTARLPWPTVPMCWSTGATPCPAVRPTWPNAMTSGAFSLAAPPYRRLPPPLPLCHRRSTMDRYATSARKRGRRSILGGALAAAAVVAAPGLARAQRKPVRLASLNSLTGAGGVYGAPMRDLVKAVVDEVNAAGGVLGSPVDLIGE